MKANEVPERIYRRLEGKYIKYYDYKPAKISYDEKEPTEYVRTDAFIEKAKKWFETQNKGFNPDGTYFCDMSDFEDFVNYMK